MDTHVTRTYLQMTGADQLRPAERRTGPGAAALRVECADPCPPSFYRYLYRTVGEPWRWRDRAEWSDERIAAHLAAPAITVLVGYVAGAPAGYYELARHDDGSVEIAYFGLIPERTGRGLGKQLLTDAVERAWAMGATRVWLHTCSLDSPAALPNYIARGFTPYREEHYAISSGSETGGAAEG